MKPSLEKSALNGLSKGLDVALNLIDSEVTGVIEHVGSEHEQQIEHLQQLIARCSPDETFVPQKADKNNPLSRMLIH
jgi:hypothetical protein